MKLRQLTESDAAGFREVRLLGLKESPTSFGASHAHEAEMPLAFFEQRLGGAPDRWVVGAFQEGQLIGVIGFVRDAGEKSRHKGFIWGMYVIPEFRGRGVGRALLQDTLARVDSLPGMRSLRLCVVSANTRALRLYGKCGFICYGVEEEALCVDGVFHAEFHLVRRTPGTESKRARVGADAEGSRKQAATIPTLETERLILRPFVLGDAAEVRRLAGDRSIADTTLNIPHPYNDGMAEEWISTHAGFFANATGATFAITRRVDGALVGAIGLRSMAKGHQAELGYWVGRPYWNQGICTEAGSAILRYAFSKLDLVRVHSSHLTRNPASGRVMQKLGMRHEGSRKWHATKWGKFEDMEFYGILKDDWVEPANPEPPPHNSGRRPPSDASPVSDIPSSLDERG